MNLEDEIAWWTRQAFKSDTDAALIAFGVATGLKLARADYGANTGKGVEANVRINGELLSVAEAMTLRVAVTSFLMGLDDGLGDDETGKAICEGYKLACRSILGKMTG